MDWARWWLMVTIITAIIQFLIYFNTLDRSVIVIDVYVEMNGIRCEVLFEIHV